MSVDGKPWIEKAPSILNKPDGSSVLFECMLQVSGSLQPTVDWYFKDQKLEAGDRYVMKVKKMVGKFAATLTIKNPTQEDQGIYKIVAWNHKGSAEKEQTYVMACTGNQMHKD